MIDFGEFPKVQEQVRCKWAPICIEPIAGSGEKLTIGVAAINEAGFSISSANSLNRLTCLYGDKAKTVIFAAQASLASLEQDLSARRMEALRDPKAAFSSVFFGEIKEGSGSSLEEISTYWLSTISSLHNVEQTELLGAGVEKTVLDIPATKSTKEIQHAVFDAIVESNKNLIVNFGDHVISDRPRRRSYSDRFIDYRSNKLVANFEALPMGKLTYSAQRITKAMWDLCVERDNSKGRDVEDKYQLFVRRATANDPGATKRKLNNISEQLANLEGQADIEGIRLHAFGESSLIANRIIQQEEAA